MVCSRLLLLLLLLLPPLLLLFLPALHPSTLSPLLHARRGAGGGRRHARRCM